MEYLFCILLAYGVSNILVNSEIASFYRNFLGRIHPKIDYLVNCITCTGFWVGLLIGFLVFSPSTLIFINSNFFIINYIFDGFIMSATSFIINSITYWLNK